MPFGVSINRNAFYINVCKICAKNEGSRLQIFLVIFLYGYFTINFL